jgi:alpha-ketoglutarate-dependent taurine dioxygenase
VALTFEDISAEAISIDSATCCSDEAQVVRERFSRHGFAVVELGAETPTPETLTMLAASLDLGAAFLPPLYMRGKERPPSISRISAASNAGTADATHPSFGRTEGQRFHCDGTLQRIGFIKTGMLLCESPAAEGGETILFNASAAFAQLASTDREAALALATDGVLIRQANINGSQDRNIGPAFTVQDGRLVCGYSVTETDSWAVPDGVDEDAVSRGIAFLDRASQPGSQHHKRFSLATGQVIVFDNTAISHGRLAYRDSVTRRRCMYRSLHLRHPRASVGPEAIDTGYAPFRTASTE